MLCQQLGSSLLEKHRVEITYEDGVSGHSLKSPHCSSTGGIAPEEVTGHEASR